MTELISSTMLQKLFFDDDVSIREFLEKAKTLVMNLDLLAIMGLNYRWNRCVCKRVSVS
jgi:hypothetical protein